MKKDFLLAGFFCVVGLSMLLCSCEKSEEASTDEVIRPVKMITLQEQSDSFSYSYPAKVEPVETADLSFEQSGSIIEFPVSRGQEVSQDQLIARLDPLNFEQSLNAAKAKVAQAEAELNRYRKLYEEDVVALADLQVTERDCKFQLAEMKMAEKAMNDTYLKAPFSGVISKQFLENFQNVQAKEPVVRLQDISILELVIDVPEKDVVGHKDHESVMAQARFDVVGDEKFNLKVTEWETEADAQTQTFRVKFKMDAPKDKNILPGMTATVFISFGSSKEATQPMFVIPSSAVFANEQGVSTVWVYDEALGSAQSKQVTLGNITGEDSIQIKEGLALGDQIVIAGVSQIREGMKVRPIVGIIGKEKADV